MARTSFTMGILALAVLTGACTGGTQEPADLVIATLPAGMEANTLPRDYTGTELDGSAFQGADLAGKIVLLDFWAVWCAPCVDAVPKLNAIRAELADVPFEVVGYAVHSGSLDDVRSFAAEHGMEYRVVRGDDEVTYDYNVLGYPTYFLLDPAGRQVRKYVGALPGLEERVIDDVRALLAAAES